VKNKIKKPTKSSISILAQVCKLIPQSLVNSLAQKHKIDDQSRTFKPWSHVVSLIYAQIAHSIGLNDVCDALGNHSSALHAIRGSTVPSKNGLSHANRTRDAKMAEDLFWGTMEHLKSMNSGFGKQGFSAMPRRFKRTIHAVDSSTIKLVANCINWAKHRGRKAAAKLHLSLDLRSFLPKFAIVDTAAHSDPRRAREVCADVREGEIVIFDKAYVDYLHLHDLDERGVSWITRAKENMSFVVLGSRPKTSNQDIISDDEVLLDQKASNEKYPSSLRRIEAWVEVDGKRRTMVFITNNLDWAPNSICDLYKSRWKIEVFFKQIKQTLQLCDFLGHNANAVRWQIWTALLVYILMRFLAQQSKWNHSFTRLFTLIRGVLWDKYCLESLLKSCGIAGGDFRLLAAPDQLYLPGFG
jgi:hypothetical protein